MTRLKQFSSAYRGAVSLAAVTLLWVACGSGTEERVFDNPHDPDRETSLDEATVSGGPSSSPDQTDGGNVSTPAEGGGTASSGTGACLTVGCTAPAESIYDFANSFSVTPAGCSSVSKVATFDTGSGLMIFVDANCGQRNSVYSLTAAYNGGSPSSPVNLTTDCNSGSAGVINWSVDQGSSGYLLAYVCNPSNYSYAVRAVPITSDGSPGTATLFESEASYVPSWNRYYSVLWNPSGSAYGVARRGRFQRFNQSGSSVGGPVTTTSEQLNSVFVLNGSWYLINSSSYAKCSKINSSGSLQCNAVTSTAPGSIGGYAGSEKLINFSTAGFTIASLNETTCATTQDYNTTETVNATITSYDALPVSTSIGGHLYKSDESLILATFPTSNSGIYSENSVTGFLTSLTGASARIANSKIYVGYAKDGGGYISYSTQSVP